MSFNKPPHTSLNSEAWEKLRALKEHMPSSSQSSQSLSPPKTRNQDNEKKASSLTKETADLDVSLKKTWQERRKEHKDIIDWLCETFPQAFNFKQPKPLKLNVTRDIYDHLPIDGTISKLKLRAALKYYTHSTFYLKALVEAADRVDLQGSATEPIDFSHKEFSQMLLAHRSEKRKVFKAKKPHKKPAINL